MKNLLINPKISINRKKKEVSDTLDHKLINWLINNSYNPIIISNKTFVERKNLFYKFLNSLNIKGIVLSGGNDIKKGSIRYLAQNCLIEYAFKKKIPILGICQGMQMLGVKFGSKLIKVKNHVKKFHKLINLSDELFPKYSNSYHRYSLKNCPKGFFITTKSFDGRIESIKHNFLPWEGWMWHPERDKYENKINKLRLKKIFK
jgi:gamma-glutamyl-gamma-aminobutyrate hydrolase PuuD